MGNMQPGEVASVPINDDFIVFKVRKQLSRSIQPLSAVKDEAKRLALLEKAPSSEEVMVRLYQDAHPVFEANQYASYFTEFEQAPVPIPRAASNFDSNTRVQTASAR